MPMRWRPELRPGPRWGSSRRSQTPYSAGEGTPPPQEPHSLGASILAPSALAASNVFSNTPLATNNCIADALLLSRS